MLGHSENQLLRIFIFKKELRNNRDKRDVIKSNESLSNRTDTHNHTEEEAQGQAGLSKQQQGFVCLGSTLEITSVLTGLDRILDNILAGAHIYLMPAPVSLRSA